MNKDAHIPTEEIMQDIRDTENEIRYMRRWNLKDWGGGTIAQREDFIIKLREILASRGVK